MNYHEYSTCRLVLPRQPKAATFLDKPSASILGPAEGFAIDVNEDEKNSGAAINRGSYISSANDSRFAR